MIWLALVGWIPATLADDRVEDQAGLAGTWVTQKGEAHIEMHRCRDREDQWCGTIVWLEDPVDEDGKDKLDTKNPVESLRSRTLLGLELVRIDGEPNKRGVYRHGRVYDVDSGKTYRCTLRLDGPDTIRMHGFIGIPLFGQSTRWSRVRSSGDGG